MNTKKVICMTEKEEKDYLRGIFLKIMPKFSDIEFPDLMSDDLSKIIDKEVNYVHSIIQEDMSEEDFIKKLHSIDWFKIFDKINEEIVIQQIKLPKI